MYNTQRKVRTTLARNGRARVRKRRTCLLSQGWQRKSTKHMQVNVGKTKAHDKRIRTDGGKEE